VEIDPEATEKLQVTMTDFRHALQNDVKPVSRCVITVSLLASQCSPLIGIYSVIRLVSVVH